MKNFVPGRLEWVVFILMAIFCGLIAQVSQHTDYALGLLGMPVFLVAAFLGHRRRLLRAQQSLDELDDQEPAV